MVELGKLETEVQFLKGVGPKWTVPMAKLGLRTVRDVFGYFPRRYDDRTNLPKMRDILPGGVVTVRGHIARLESKSLRGGRVILSATLSDGTGHIILTWFNQPWIRKKLEDYSGEVIAFGNVKQSGRYLEIASPELELIEDDDDADDFARIMPVYPLTEGVPQTVIRKATGAALEYYLGYVEDPLPASWAKSVGLEKLQWALREIHRPSNLDNRDIARKRLVFEEFLYTQLSLQLRRRETKQEIGIPFPIDEAPKGDVNGTLFVTERAPGESMWDEVKQLLPFELTNAQTRVIKEIYADMKMSAPMNRLVQGDVGSGKTAVAVCAMLAAVRCGYQAAMMAPTEILAEQHYINLHKLFDKIGINVVLLHGKMPAPKKRKAVQQAANGEAQILVGTHALVQDAVEFRRLGLAIIDEQHRFGVLQRAALRQKGRENPDVLVMTATPIPRTLTMTLYGDLETSIIDELPPGRKPIKTHWKAPADRPQVYEAVRKLLWEGRQAYFVCPMIAENEKMQTQAAEDLYYRLSEEVYTEFKVGLLHGQLKSSEKEEIMEKFRAHELDVLVSTVVIEVGVDVPNATTMVIEDANRFGLAQLHQLRGRVGRGDQQSYCILVSDAKSEEAYERLTAIRDTTDGFKIAETDLRLRGPGEVAGTRQSGQFEFKLADLVKDQILLEQARQLAMKILDDDPNLEKPEHALMLTRVREKRLQMGVITIS